MRFEFKESLYGGYFLVDEPEKQGRLTVAITAFSNSFLDFLQNGRLHIFGTITMDRITQASEMTGVLEISPMTKKKLIYEFLFKDEKGNQITYYGEKHLRYLDLFYSVTTLHGSFYMGNRELARSELKFHMNESLLDFLLSLRLIPQL